MNVLGWKIKEEFPILTSLPLNRPQRQLLLGELHNCPKLLQDELLQGYDEQPHPLSKIRSKKTNWCWIALK